MNLQLDGQRVLVTGGSKGIGLAIARAFAAEGAKPVIVSRDTANIAKALTAFAEAGLPVPETITMDLAAPGSAQALHAAVGDIDILVNNAGAIPGGSLHDVDEARWRNAWELKLYSYVNLTRVYLPLMEGRGRGVICNIIGMAGQAPRYDYICGSTANAALMSFTRAVGAGSVRHGVRVFGINPAPTRSDRMQGMLEAKAQRATGDASRWAEFVSPHAMGRMAEPDEIAHLVVSCASPRCGYLSGTVIDVDGGHQYDGA
jgi:NAD(P)-dependent dehydrogenase (short-subunit alcohol dehydrogenase family)